MSPEKQRIAIAAACGWKTHESATHGWCMTRPDGHEWFGFSDEETAWTCAAIPDYLNSLDAMYEAEEAVGVDSYPRRERYLYTLMDVVKRDGDRMAICATAPQRAEAFLKTLGLWESTTMEPTQMKKGPTESSP